MDLAKTLHLDDIDRFQQRHAPLAFVAGVLKKFGDDRGGQLAALLTYYGFISLFPLLLVFVTILGFVLQGHSDLERQIEHGTLGQFPLIGDQLKGHSLSGSGFALAVGFALTLLGGLGVTNMAQFAFNRIWSVPITEQPNFLIQRLRGVRILAILGLLTIISSVAGGFVGASNHDTSSGAALAAGVVVSLGVNFILFMSAFKLLTATDLPWRQLVAGAITATVLWALLQYLGGLYISHELKHTGPLYGSFALVLGLLAWIYLGARLILVAAEVNVVLARRLWPRTFFGDGLLDADKRAIRAAVKAEDRSNAETIEVTFKDPAPNSAPAADRPREDPDHLKPRQT